MEIEKFYWRKEGKVDIYSAHDLVPELSVPGTKSPWVSFERAWFKLWPRGVPKTLRYPEVPLFELLNQAAERFGNNVAVCFVPEDKKYTYYEYGYFTDKLAAALSNRFNIGKGKSVAVMTWNRPEYLFSLYGILKTGASCTPINPLLQESDVEHIIRDAGIIDTIFIHESLYPMLKDVMETSGIKNFIVLGEGGFPGTMKFWDLIKDYRPEPPEVDIDPKEDVACLLYTGGTTGLPKGTILTHFNLVADALQCVASAAPLGAVQANLGRGVSLIVLPICHSFGFTMVTIAIYMGTTMVMFDRFDPQEALEAIEKYKITNFQGIPTMYVMLVNCPDIQKYDLSSLQICSSGAGALPPEIAKTWKELTSVTMSQGYGLTEASPVTHNNPSLWSPCLIKIESIGIPLIDTDAAIVDPETGKELPPGKEGELLIRGPQVMKGYWKHPEETGEVLKSGWLHTGDIAKMDEEGYFYIVGRLKEMIKYKGYRLFPLEIEEKLYEHPAIQECAVIGVPDTLVGENIKVFIVLKGEYEGKVTEKDIIDWAKKNIAPHKYPRIVEFRDALPKTPVGKVFRRLLISEKMARL
jgi:long-chain acyl-CoA synthetase